MMTEHVSKANEILEALKTNLSSEGFSLVTLRRLGISELSDSEFDAVVITQGREVQNILNQGQADIEWQITLSLMVMKGNYATAYENWNEKAALIGRIIATDRTLGGKVISAIITGRTRDLTVFEPYASGTVELSVHFRFNEITQGG